MTREITKNTKNVLIGNCNNSYVGFNELEKSILFFVKKDNYKANDIIIKITMDRDYYYFYIDNKGNNRLMFLTSNFDTVVDVLTEYDRQFFNSNRTTEDEEIIYNVILKKLN